MEGRTVTESPSRERFEATFEAHKASIHDETVRTRRVDALLGTSLRLVAECIIITTSSPRVDCLTCLHSSLYSIRGLMNMTSIIRPSLISAIAFDDLRSTDTCTCALFIARSGTR